MEEAYALARQQDGVILDEQVLSLGVARRTLQRRIREGAWIRLRRGVLVTPGTPINRITRSRGLILLHPSLIITGPAAGDFLGEGPWQLGVTGRLPWVAHEHGRQVRMAGVKAIPHPGIVPRRSNRQLATDLCLLSDIIRFTSPQRARHVALAALQQRLVTLSDLLSEADKLRLATGHSQFMRVLGEVGNGAHAESEFQFHGLLQNHGFADWEANYPVRLPDGRLAYIDVAFPDAKVAVEIDGYRYHSDRAAFEHDRFRGNELLQLGWRVLRFTWQQLTNDPQYVVNRLRQVLLRSG